MAKSIPALLRSYDLSPRKRLGQNFLTDPSAAQRIVSAASLSSEDTVVEVGAGLGVLTRLLAEQAGQVLAVELDDGLVRVLNEQLADLPNVRIIHGDILQLPDQIKIYPPLVFQFQIIDKPRQRVGDNVRLVPTIPWLFHHTTVK